MSGLATAMSFLTRVPMGRRPRDERDLAAAVPWFPVVGALVGAAVAGASALGREVLPPAVAAPIAVGFGALITGGFHEDGLADTADALGTRTGREEALRILRDPRLGTFGVLALVITIAIRVAAIASLAPQMAFAVIPTAHVLSRGAAVVALATVPPATDDGLGAGYARRVTRGTATTGVLVAIALAGAAAGAWALAFLPAVLAASVALVVLARRRLGGITGDVLGAVQQLGEAAVLVVGAAIAFRPWWA